MKKVVFIVLVASIFLNGCSAQHDEVAVSASSSLEEVMGSTEEIQEKENEIDREALYSALVINTDPNMYTYDNLVNDAEIISILYRDYLIVDSLGTTADGRELYHFVVGNPNAEKEIFINANIHAREYITTQLVMKQMVTYIENIIADNSYGDIKYQDMWDSVAVHVVPSINPDGTAISQFGLEGINKEKIRQKIIDIATMDGTTLNAYYLDTWKSNAMGVDLNRNFDAWWERYYDYKGHPSSDHHKGEYPGSEIESAALINLTNNNNFLYTISYHTMGQVIYWNFENIDSIYNIAASWVAELSNATGYYIISDYTSVDPAGYSDWAIYRCQIPSVVLEVAYGESPYLSSQFHNIVEQNKTVWEITLVDAMKR